MEDAGRVLSAAQGKPGLRRAVILPSLIKSLVTSLLLTLLLELTLAYALGVLNRHDLLLVFLVNLLTNPLVGITLDGIYLFGGAFPAWYWIALSELAAVLAEWGLYRLRLRERRVPPLLLSLLLNLFSYFGGVLYDKVFFS
ncbi:MAG: hypothetical protein IJK40_02835 [Clostridia bacterium]|nr:hypothetical protein [Clostridia bacterium]MBR0537060.1 hypothetical protein [Clostridia bacterium]